MPLQDHFHAPLKQTHPWRGFHSAWAAAIARHLNREVLPSGYYAVPTSDIGGPIEIDVATVKERAEAEGEDVAELKTWTAPEPEMTATIDWPPLETIEVQVYFDEDGPQLMAAIELVSPSNKDRPSERRAFAVKCAGYLQQGSSVVIIDAVTVRNANLHNELLELLEISGLTKFEPPTGLYAVAYRMVAEEEEQGQLQVWPHTLSIGSPLPTLPLWLGTDISVALDLEVCYQTTCEDLRIRDAG